MRYRFPLRTIVFCVASAVHLSLAAQQQMPSLLSSATPPISELQSPQTIDLSERAEIIADVAARIRSSLILAPQKKIVVDGKKVATSWWISANEIIFKPGAELIFPESVYKQSRELFIVADKVILEDPQKPPVITWDKPVKDAPDGRGQAPNGANGSGYGADGGLGAAGAPGSTGSSGSDAPSLTLMAKSLNGAISIDFRGTTGSDGGLGQRGGDGGSGSQGSPARQSRTSGPFGTTIWNPWCESGPGQGGRGGDGGSGGPGGLGGAGGRGGSVTLVSIPDALPTFTQAIKFDVGGGTPGNGGPGGTPGNGGQGGPEGQLANFCNSAGRGGTPGGSGTPGNTGQKGEPGVSGRTYISQLSAEQFAQLFGF